MIEFQQVEKRYGGQVIFDRADLRLNVGERVGIVGPNGAGKSTLFDLMVGDADADAGRIIRAKHIKIGYLRQHIPEGEGETPLQTFVERAARDVKDIHEEILRLEASLGGDDEETHALLARLGELQTQFEVQGGYDLHARTAATLAGLGFQSADLQRPLGEFSGGWQMRAELARALMGEPDLLLLDEPSNYLDLPAVEWLRRRLEVFQGTLAMISHDRYLLEALCRITVEVANGRLTRYPGRYSWYAREREKRREVSLARQANDQRRRAQLERFVERFRYKSSLSTRVQSKIKLLEKMETVDVVDVVRGRGRFQLRPPPHCGHDVVRCDKAGFGYADGAWVFRDVDVRIHKGEKVAVVGPNGAGKTTLLRMMAGLLTPREGQCSTGHLVAPGYQSQEAVDTMSPTRTCFETLRAVAPDAAERDIRTLLGGFGFSGGAIEKRVEVLSGGERIRLAFARILINPPNLLLLDEPTTHLDVESREALQDAIAAYEGTVVIVSHDVEFVRAVAGRIVEVLPNGGGVRCFAGGYDYYCEKTAAAPSASSGGKTSSPDASENAPPATTFQDRKRLKTELRKMEKQVAELEKAVMTLETEQAGLLQRLSSADGTPAQRAEDGRRLKAVEEELAANIARWEEAGQQRDTLAAALQ